MLFASENTFVTQPQNIFLNTCKTLTWTINEIPFTIEPTQMQRSYARNAADAKIRLQ